MSVINQMLKDLDSRRGQPAGPLLAGLLSWGPDRGVAHSGLQAARWVLVLAAAAGIGTVIWQSGRQNAVSTPFEGAGAAFQPAVVENNLAAAQETGADPSPAARSRINEIAWERGADGVLELVLTLDRMPGAAIAHEKHDNGDIEYLFPSTQLDAGLPMLAEDNPYYAGYRLGTRGDDVRLRLTPREGVIVSAGPAGERDAADAAWAVRAQVPPAPRARAAAPVKKSMAGTEAEPPQAVRAKSEEKSPPPADPVKTPVDPRRTADQSYRRALEYLRADRVEPAVAQLNKALNARPAFHAARELLASLYLRTGRDTEAHLLLREGMTLDEAYLNFPKLSARALIERGRLEEASKVLAAGASHAAADAEYQALYAALAQRLGEHENAAGRYMLALEIEPARGAWWLGLAISLEALGRDREAADAYAAAGRSGQLGAEVSAYVRERLKALGGER